MGPGKADRAGCTGGLPPIPGGRLSGDHRVRRGSGDGGMNDVALTLRQVRYTNKAFWRNPASAGFTFAFPLMFLVIFTALFGNSTTCVVFGAAGKCLKNVKTSTFYVSAIGAFSIITATYTNLAIGVTFQRDAGILKRVRGA